MNNQYKIFQDSQSSKKWNMNMIKNQTIYGEKQAETT